MAFRKKPTEYVFEIHESDYPKCDTEKDHIYCRRLIAEPFNWMAGAAIRFGLVEDFSEKGGDNVGIIRTREIFHSDYYDEMCTDDHSLRRLIGALYQEDLRGRFEEETVWYIFYQLCLMPFKDKENWVNHWLPNFYNRFKRLHEQELSQNKEKEDGC